MNHSIIILNYIEIKGAHSPKRLDNVKVSIFFSDRTDSSEPLHLKDTLQLLCNYVRRINLHISVRTIGEFAFSNGFVLGCLL